jgi:Helix-turn-helix domain
MSWSAVKKLLELAPTSGLSDREFRVLLVLCERLNTRTGQLNPAARRIARDIGLEPTDHAVRSVRRTIATLERKGWLQRVGSKFGGRPEGHYRSQFYRLRGDLMSPLDGAPGVTQETTRGDTDDHLKGDLMSPEPRKLGTWEENLPSGSTNRLAPPPQSGGASTQTPNRSGRISDALLARVRELDPDAERRTRHDGTEWIELSDGEALPNSKRAEMWTRYSPEATY